MSKPELLAVEKAVSLILSELEVMPAEACHIKDAAGRILAEDIHAKYAHPDNDVSAMDGYAVCVESSPLPQGSQLHLIGEAAAGHPYSGQLHPGQAARIFTGAWLPKGANAILLQEDASADGSVILTREDVKTGQFVRKKGLDFAEGERLLPSGTALNARAWALAALAGAEQIQVRKRPRIGILSSGDELVPAGTRPSIGQLVNSNSLYLSEVVRHAGAEVIDLGIIEDRRGALGARIANAATDKSDRPDGTSLDIILCTGGASVGDHDHIHDELAEMSEGRLNFWRIAMRPGKPLMFGMWGKTPFLGLPGNPVSAGVCALIFILPALRALFGQPQQDKLIQATLATPLKQNDKRQEYMRAQMKVDADGHRIVTPMPTQDSSMLRMFTDADALIIRPPFAPAAEQGDTVPILPIPDYF